jgi:hypothetical protein
MPVAGVDLLFSLAVDTPALGLTIVNEDLHGTLEETEGANGLEEAVGHIKAVAWRRCNQ